MIFCGLNCQRIPDLLFSPFWARNILPLTLWILFREAGQVSLSLLRMLRNNQLFWSPSIPTASIQLFEVISPGYDGRGPRAVSAFLVQM
jgi:hypothetical protein